MSLSLALRTTTHIHWVRIELRLQAEREEAPLPTTLSFVHVLVHFIHLNFQYIFSLLLQVFKTMSYFFKFE